MTFKFFTAKEFTPISPMCPPVRAANILHIVVEVKAVFPTRRRARWNSMAVDGARFVERGPCCRV